jgi:hypothetical protein
MKSLKQNSKAFERFSKRSCLVVLLLSAAAASFLSGCASTEPDNYSERPWDSPKSWETGLPSALTEGR